MRFNGLLLCNISRYLSSSKPRLTDNLFREVDIYGRASRLDGRKLFCKLSAAMCHDSFDELFEEEKYDFDASLARKQFPSIMLGQSTPVELYDGIADGSEKSSVLTKEICSELLHSSIGIKVVDPNMLYDSWGSVANKFNQFSSDEIESRSDQGSIGSTCCPPIFQVETSSSLKEERSQNTENSDLKSAVDDSFNRGAVKDQTDTVPFEFILDKSVSGVATLSKKQCSQLENCGLHTIRKLLSHFPRTYADLQNAQFIIADGQYLIFVGKVLSSRGIKASCSLSFLEVIVGCEVSESGSGSACSVSEKNSGSKRTIYLHLKKFFRGTRFTYQPFLRSLQEKQKVGDVVCVSGKVRTMRTKDHYELREYSMDLIRNDDDESACAEGRPYPIYPSKGGLNPRLLGDIIARVLDALPSDIDPIPKNILQMFGLKSLRDAYIGIHQPANFNEADLARKRIIFDEFFHLQLARLYQMLEGLGTRIEKDGLLEKYRNPATNAVVAEEWCTLTKQFMKILPYSLTSSQLNAVSEIIWDLKRQVPMNRLLQGDVGCGKTVIAFLACMEVIGSGYQAAFMVPTELLAIQHHDHLLSLLEKMEDVDSKPSVALLTGSTPAKKARQIREGLHNGEIELVIGTHSLIAEKVEFSSLRIAVVDEQHRFGVIQRGRFNSKLYTNSVTSRSTEIDPSGISKDDINMAPHVLAMTATPIPRTLALALYGDMSLTQITDLPPGRKPIDTFIVLGNETGFDEVYQMMKEELDSGGRVYIVYPIIDQSEQLPQLRARQAAGLLLKNNLKTAFKSMPPTNQEYIKAELLPCLGSADRQIRSTFGTIISVLVQIGGVLGWPELLHSLVKCLDSNDLTHMEGAMDALSKICEDIPQVLEAENPGSSERPIDIFLPRLLALFQSPHATLRKLALGSVNQYIMLMPPVLYMAMDTYLQGLFVLANDPSSEVRKLVCSAFVQLIEVRPSFLEPHLRNVIEYMLQVNKDPDDEVSLEACEFWSAYCEAPLPPENLRAFLPRLIPVLLSNMAYAEDDESLLDAEEDGSLPDRDQDLKPRFHSSRFHGSDDAEDDDDDIVNIWNLRKCSAAALDMISNVFGDEILPTLMPFVQSKLATLDDASWKEREAAVLALGAIAEGCINGLYPHLSEIVAFLIPLLDDKFPLIRSISCWTLSRFSKFIVQGIGHREGHEQFEKVLTGLLRRILDNNKRVQEAACSAFATLEEEAADELAPRLEIILKHLMCAYGKYQRRNLRIVYDAIGTLADAVGGELNQPKYLEILMPPLIAKWQQLSNSDKDLFPLLECFTSIAQALGSGFSQFSQPVFQRCLDIIQTQQLAKVDPVSAGVQFDKEFVVCSLDLLSGLTEGLGGGIESLVSQSNLRDLLLQCCMDDSADIRQSAFALLGDLARVCPIHLRPRLPEFLEVAAKQLNTPKLKETISVANNACWAIGELAIKVNQEISPVVMTVISCLVPILQHAEGLNKSLIENSAITLGRLASVCPELVSPHMEHFMQSWCIALAMIRDDIEKEDAFRGLCAMVKANPSGALSSLVFLCRAIASWHEIRSEELHNEVSQVLLGYKQMLKNGAWEQCMSALEPPVIERLSKYKV